MFDSVASSRLLRAYVKHFATAECGVQRLITQHDAIASVTGQGVIADNFCPDLVVGGVGKYGQPPSAVTGGVIDVYRHPVFQAPWETRGLIQSDGDGTIARGRFGGDPVAALKFIQ